LLWTGNQVSSNPHMNNNNTGALILRAIFPLNEFQKLQN
jgi:hypothetical protein